MLSFNFKLIIVKGGIPMVKETLERKILIFEYLNDNRFTYSRIKPEANNSQLLTFAEAFNSLQKNKASNFAKEERFILEEIDDDN